MYRGLFYVQWFEVRVACSFCSLALFKFSFHNVRIISAETFPFIMLPSELVPFIFRVF